MRRRWLKSATGSRRSPSMLIRRMILRVFSFCARTGIADAVWRTTATRSKSRKLPAGTPQDTPRPGRVGTTPNGMGVSIYGKAFALSSAPGSGTATATNSRRPTPDRPNVFGTRLRLATDGSSAAPGPRRAVPDDLTASAGSYGGTSPPVPRLDGAAAF